MKHHRVWNREEVFLQFQPKVLGEAGNLLKENHPHTRGSMGVMLNNYTDFKIGLVGCIVNTLKNEDYADFWDISPVF